MAAKAVATLSGIQPQLIDCASVAEDSAPSAALAGTTLQRLWPWLLWGAHAGLILATTLRHEVWRDEAQAWLIATASSGPSELFSHLRYEGHPALWYACLWLLGRVTDHPAAMQLFHALLAIATAALLIFASPFRLWQKALLVFGYFFVYEYAAISRSYGMGVLLTFAVCALISRRPRPMIWIGGLLFLLANTSIYGAILSAGIGAGLAVDWLMTGTRERRTAAWRIGVAVLLCAVGVAACYHQVRRYPADEPRFNTSFETVQSTGQALGKLLPLARAVLPIHVQSESPWGTHYLINYQPYPVRFWFAMAGALLVGAATLVLLPKPALWTTAAVAGGGLLAFTAFVFEGFTRHHGHYFVLVIVVLWLWHQYVTPHKPRLLARAEALLNRARPAGTALLAALLCVHVYAGFQAALWDLQHPFSRAAEVAGYLRRHYPEGTLIMGFRDAPASTVAAHLRRPMLYLESQRFGGPVNWKARNSRPPGASSRPLLLVQEALVRHSGSGEGVVVSQVNLESSEQLMLEEVARFGPGREEFVVYWARRND